MYYSVLKRIILFYCYYIFIFCKLLFGCRLLQTSGGGAGATFDKQRRVAVFNTLYPLEYY